MDNSWDYWYDTQTGKYYDKNWNEYTGRVGHAPIKFIPKGMLPGVKRDVQLSRVSVAECTRKFAIAQRHPFYAWKSNMSEVCMPDSVVLATAKRRIVAKGTGGTGNNNLGYLSGNYHVVTNDQACGQVTELNNAGVGSSTLIAAVWDSLGTGVATGTLYSNAEFATADLAASSLEYRTCAFGIRLRYTGTHDNMGGTVFAYRSPSNTNLNPDTFDAIANHKNTIRYPFDREWTSVVWKVATPDDTDFATAQPAIMPMVILIQSAAPNVTFEWEIVNFHELVGQKVNDTTISHSDPQGFGATQAATTKVPDSHHGNGPSAASIINSVKESVAEAATYIHGNETLNNVFRFGAKACSYIPRPVKQYATRKIAEKAFGTRYPSKSIVGIPKARRIQGHSCGPAIKRIAY